MILSCIALIRIERSPTRIARIPCSSGRALYNRQSTRPLSERDESVMQQENAVKELVERMVRALVDHPDEVEVVEVEGQHSSVLELHVAREDIGKVIGKRGAHAQALRTIVAAAGGKLKRRYILEIIEDRFEGDAP